MAGIIKNISSPITRTTCMRRIFIESSVCVCVCVCLYSIVQKCVCAYTVLYRGVCAYTVLYRGNIYKSFHVEHVLFTLSQHTCAIYAVTAYMCYLRCRSNIVGHEFTPSQHSPYPAQCRPCPAAYTQAYSPKQKTAQSPRGYEPVASQ